MDHRSPLLSLQSVVKRFGSFTAVAGVDLDLRAGETLGLLGPNGAGKTTTISMMVGTLSPDGGTVRMGDYGSPSDPAVRARLGYCPQALAVYEMLTAEENLRLFGSLYGLRGGRLSERVGWCLDFAGLAERAGSRVVTFSGGMKRRLNLACALMHEPELLLLDEPTVGVDPQSRNLIFERIESLRAAGMTLLYTTHYMEEATRLCDRIAIMDSGRILALDTLDGLLRSHAGPTRVQFELADGALVQSLPEGARLEGRHLIVESGGDPVSTVQRVATWGFSISGFHTVQPTLEDVFLGLTGKTLRD